VTSTNTKCAKFHLHPDVVSYKTRLWKRWRKQCRNTLEK